MKARVLTALVGIPFVLAAVACANPWPMFLLVLLAALACHHEAARMFSAPATSLLPAAVLAATLVAGLPPMRSLEHAMTIPGALVLLAAGVFGAHRALGPNDSLVDRSLGVLWYAIPLTSLCLLHAPGDSQAWDLAWRNPVFLVLVPVWAGDIAAMLVGRAFGKRLMAPSLSPKKTWEGSWANLAASIGAGWAVGVGLGYEAWIGLACGAAVGIFGQAGDLFESALKRKAGIKDSGTLLPGHGGVLDRIDALLFTINPVWAILALSGVL